MNETDPIFSLQVEKFENEQEMPWGGNGVAAIALAEAGHSEVYRRALQTVNPEAALDVLGIKEMGATVFSTPLRLYSAQEMAAPFSKYGFRVLGQYGVRCISDPYPYLLLARFFKLVLKKEGQD